MKNKTCAHSCWYFLCRIFPLQEFLSKIYCLTSLGFLVFVCLLVVSPDRSFLVWIVLMDFCCSNAFNCHTLCNFGVAMEMFSLNEIDCRRRCCRCHSPVCSPWLLETFMNIICSHTHTHTLIPFLVNYGSSSIVRALLNRSAAAAAAAKYVIGANFSRARTKTHAGICFHFFLCCFYCSVCLHDFIVNNSGTAKTKTTIEASTNPPVSQPASHTVVWNFPIISIEATESGMIQFGSTANHRRQPPTLLCGWLLFLPESQKSGDINVSCSSQLQQLMHTCVLYANFRGYLDHFVTHYYQVMLLCLFGYFVLFCLFFFFGFSLSCLQLPNDFHSQSYVRSKFLCLPFVVGAFFSSHTYARIHLFTFVWFSWIMLIYHCVNRFFCWSLLPLCTSFMWGNAKRPNNTTNAAHTQLFVCALLLAVVIPMEN